MATVSYRLEDLKKAIVGIGYVGENDHMHVLIDCKEVFDEYPDAVPTMCIVPPVGNSYPKVVNRNGDVVEWLVKNSDVAAEGDGEFQITFTEGEVIKKSVNGRFRVIRSISGSGNAPSGYEDWETDANEKLAAVEEATQKAEDAAEHQPRINASGYWEIWDAETGAYVATSTKAQGDKGDPGDPGTPGDPTELLDDTAGEGDTNKTWSADKIDGEIADVKTDITKLTPSATDADIGKALIVKTVEDGKPTAYEYGEIGGGSDIDDEAGAGDTDKVWSADKTTEELEEKAPVIVIEKEQAYYHEESPFEVTLEPEERASAINARYANCKNLLSEFYQTGSYSGVTRSRSGRFTNLTGTSTGGIVLLDTQSSKISDFAGKTYHFYMTMKKATALSGFDYFVLQVNGSNNILKKYNSGRNTLLHFEVTFPDTVTRILLKYNSLNGSVFESGDCVWWGLYENELIDAGQVVDSEAYTFNVSDLAHFDSVFHKSTIKYKADTKEYVDSHIPDILGFWNDNVYVLPEHFGAKGDGTADDTNALQDAIDYAITNGKPLRGYNKYKTTEPIVIVGQNLDILINNINYTGNVAALQITSLRSKFTINQITSGGIGVLVVKTGNNAFSYNIVEIQKITATSHAISFDASGSWCLYNVFRIKEASSTNGNVYNNQNAVVHENDYYDTSCSCPNGWAIKSCNGRMYNFTLESNVLNGILLNNTENCEFTGFRYRELIDKLIYRENGTQPDLQGGTLIKIVGKAHSVTFRGNDAIPYTAIDVSEMTPVEDFVSADDKAGTSFLNVIDAQIRYGNWDSLNGYFALGQKMIIVAGKKICVPAYETEYEITEADYDMRTSKRIYPTKMIIGVDDCIIHLSPSYSSYGYNDFIVDQNQGHLCTIYSYDDDTTPIFDGDTFGAGVYQIKCRCDIYNSGIGTGGHKIVNTGSNDKWEITKLN